MSSVIEFNIEEELKKLPKKPGVYLMHGPEDEILYIGKAISLYNRVHQYFQSPESKSAKIRKMISLIRRFEYIVVGSELEALVLENNLIKENRPRYNTLLKDDKTYPYIKVSTAEAFPRICQTRKFHKDGSRYFGPYTTVTAVRECIDLLHRLFMIRTCSRVLPRDCGKERPCLYHHLGQCLAPCTGRVTETEYRDHLNLALDFLSGKYGYVKNYLTGKMTEAAEELRFEQAAEYRDLLKAVDALSAKQKVTSTDTDDRDIIGLAGSLTDTVAQVFFIRGGIMIGRENFHLDSDPEESMEEKVRSFLSRFYTGTPSIPPAIWIQTEIPDRLLMEEWLSRLSGRHCRIVIPKTGDKRRFVEMAVENAEIVLNRDSERLRKEELRTRGACNEICRLLGLPLLRRIESFDISNTNGFEPVASMVVFYDGQPKNSDYRKFRIRTVQGPDDYASMREVLIRRFGHSETDSFGEWPDLILMDGGLGQVHIAESVISELGLHLPVAGMVKDDRHRTRGLIYHEKELPVDIHSEAFRLITRIQDETHRFAVEFHRSLRLKKQTHSVLDEIPGIGPKRRNSLLRSFRDLDELKNAGTEELLRAEGMDRRSAESVYAFFHGEL